MADLKGQVVSGVAIAFKTIDSFLKPIVLIYGRGAYDPLTDTTPEGAQTASIRGLLYTSTEQQSADSTGNSATILLQNSDVIAAGLAGVIDEAYKATVDGKTWEITGVIYDPADATAKLYVRHG